MTHLRTPRSGVSLNISLGPFHELFGSGSGLSEFKKAVSNMRNDLEPSLKEKPVAAKPATTKLQA